MGLSLRTERLQLLLFFCFYAAPCIHNDTLSNTISLCSLWLQYYYMNYTFHELLAFSSYLFIYYYYCYLANQHSAHVIWNLHKFMVYQTDFSVIRQNKQKAIMYKVDKGIQDLIQWGPHQVLNIKGEDRQIQLNHYENTPIQISTKFHHQNLEVFR